MELEGFKTITYNENKMKSSERAEEIASWYLTNDVDLYFSAKKFGRNRSIEVAFFFKNGDKYYQHNISPYIHYKMPYHITIPPETDFFAINIRFRFDVSYFHVGIDCERIKFAYKYYKKIKEDHSFEVGSFVKYDKGYRFFPNTNFFPNEEFFEAGKQVILI